MPSQWKRNYFFTQQMALLLTRNKMADIAPRTGMLEILFWRFCIYGNKDGGKVIMMDLGWYFVHTFI